MYIYEFLWRGKVDGTNAYHVVLADEITDSFGNIRHIESGALTPEQAEAQGFALADIIEGINASVMGERDQALADKATAETVRDQAIAERDQVRASAGLAPGGSFLARQLLDLLTPQDYTAVQSAIAGSAELGLLWASLLGRGDAPISASSDRFLAGWAGLSAAIGSQRASEIAASLGFAAA